MLYGIRGLRGVFVVEGDKMPNSVCSRVGSAEHAFVRYCYLDYSYYLIISVLVDGVL